MTSFETPLYGIEQQEQVLGFGLHATKIFGGVLDAGNYYMLGVMRTLERMSLDVTMPIETLIDICRAALASFVGVM